MGDLLVSGSTLIAAEKAEGSMNATGFIFYLVLTLAVIFGLMIHAKAGIKERVFKRWSTQWFEQLYLFIENMCVGIIGNHGRKYVPMILTFWLVIFIANLIGLIFPETITAQLGFNLGMALISIGYVQYEGMRSSGVGGHFKHFAGPKLAGLMMIITPVIFLIEVVSEAMKNVSLSLRLFGNIHGGHEAVVAMNHVAAIHIGDAAYYLPFGALLLPIKLLTCLVQALIFSVLTCVYLSLVTHHDTSHDHEDEGGEHGQPELAAAH